MIRLRILVLVCLALVACHRTPPTPAPPASSSATPADVGVETTGAILTVSNDTASPTTLYVAFGSDSVVVPSTWPFCTATSGLTCTVQLAAKSSQPLPLAGRYVNATMGFGAPVGCGTTKAEVNLNNPKWYDTADVSLVDGYSTRIAIEVSDARGLVYLGPPVGATGNEKVLGVFPLGCDVCVARQSPPCGIAPGKTGCKSGTQYKPDVPCQYQGATMGGGGAYRVQLVDH